MEEEVSIREMAISEVVSGPYIGECNFENCPADVVVAPFGPSQRSVAHLGILSVRQTLLDPDGEAILGFGKYILHADKDDNGEPILPLYVSGLDEESGEVISYVEMPSSLASLVNPETNDAGEVAISGCKLWKVCLFWEWRC